MNIEKADDKTRGSYFKQLVSWIQETYTLQKRGSYWNNVMLLMIERAKYFGMCKEC